MADVVQFNMRVNPEIKKAFIATKPKGVSMQRWIETCLIWWVKMPHKERLKLFIK